MEYVLKTTGLTKKYGMRNVVDHVNMNIKKGEIYGFIGRNGAGKTTLMRMILGLAKPTEGSFELFEGLEGAEAGRKMGSLIENPCLYDGVTAFENMKRFAILNDVPDEEINAILQYVGLGEVGKKKVKQFSLGMKQRLGIAIAMLGNPEFLVLDEPVNGLDPAGMKEIRELIIRLNKEKGITVLISSHLLEELSKLVTMYGIINNGQLIEEISAEDLETKCQRKLLIEVDDEKRAREIIKTNYNDIPIKEEENTLIVTGLIEESGKVNKLLVENGIEVKRLEYLSESLENYFMKRIGE